MGLHLTNIHNAFFEGFKQGRPVRFAFENTSGERVEKERGMQRLEKGRTWEAVPQPHSQGCGLHQRGAVGIDLSPPYEGPWLLEHGD